MSVPGGTDCPGVRTCLSRYERKPHVPSFQSCPHREHRGHGHGRVAGRVRRFVRPDRDGERRRPACARRSGERRRGSRHPRRGPEGFHPVVRHRRGRRHHHEAQAAVRRPLPDRQHDEDVHGHRPATTGGRREAPPRRHRREVAAGCGAGQRARRQQDHRTAAAQPHQRHLQLHQRPAGRGQPGRSGLPRPPLRQRQAPATRRHGHESCAGLRAGYVVGVLQHQLHPGRDDRGEGLDAPSPPR